MKEVLLLYGYELVTVVLPAAAVALAFWLRGRKDKDRRHTKHLIGCLVYACYLFALLEITGAGTVYDIARYGVNPRLINLIPFSDRDLDVVGYALNVVLFLPLGILLPLLWTEFGSLKAAAISGALTSLVIELSQLINSRVTDIDDLILNTLGAILGFVAFKLIARIRQCEIPAETGMKKEMILMTSAAFLGRFFLYNEFGMVKLLYGI